MCLSIFEDSDWSTVDLGDVANATYSLCFTDNYSKNDILIIFTTHDTITAKDVVSAANEGLDRDMTYERVDPKELAAYLKKIRGDNRFRRRPFEQLGLLEKDRPYTFPLGKYLTDNNIETILEWWRLADTGYTDVISYDLGRALGHSPQTISLFFKQNSDQFRLLR
jgi:hypothetical protein